MTVRDAKAVAREWVLGEAAAMEGFYGAVFHGSVNNLQEESMFPATSDLDILIVVQNIPPVPKGKFLFQNVLLEVSYLPVEEVSEPEKVLSTYYLAESFKDGAVILDPAGMLSLLVRTVSEDFAKKYWVRQRCMSAEKNARKFLHHDTHLSLPDQVTNWLFGRGVLTHILLVAGLKNPTVRKRYQEVKILLKEYVLLDFYEQLLQVSGFADLTVKEVERHFANMTDLYDFTCGVIRSPYRFAADISAAGRPIVTAGSAEMIGNGYHREAMFWIVATYCRCMHVLLDDDREGYLRYNEMFLELLRDLKIGSYEERLASNSVAINFITEVNKIAEYIISKNPDIR